MKQRPTSCCGSFRPWYQFGTIRTFKLPGTTYYRLSALAVLKDYRRYNFGRELALALHDWSRTMH